MAYFEINDLLVTHRSFEGTKTVLDIGRLHIQKGETYGLVGESGQGKTVLALTIQRLLRCPPGKVERGEDLVRALAVVSRNTIAVMDHVNTAEVLKNAVIRGAISHAEAIGKAFRTAKAAGEDYVAAVTKTGKGKPMFEGTVTHSTYETRDGYTYGDTVIEGSGDYAGHTLRIWYQNENIISWLDDAYFVTVPDLICVFDLDHAEPQLNPYARIGERVAVVALPAHAEWITPRGLEVFGPRSFGYDTDYAPYC